MQNVNGVTLTQIRDFITEKTGIEYVINIGEEKGFGDNVNCYMLSPAYLGELECKAGLNEENDTFYFEAINVEGENVFEDSQIVFLWSFDLDTCDKTGIKYLHREAIENHVLCLNMLNYDYRQDILNLIK